LPTAFALILFCSIACGQKPDMMYSEFSPDGKMILTADFDNLKFRLFTATGEFIREIPMGLKKAEEGKEPEPGGIGADNPSLARFSQDGKSVFVIYDNNLISWNIALQKEIMRINGIGYADLSYDRQWLILTNEKSTLVYNTNTWKIWKSINVTGTARISPNNKTLAISTLVDSSAHDLKFFDMVTGKAVKKFASTRGLALYPRYSPDGKYFVFVDDDWSVLRLVDGISGKILDSLAGSFNTFFSPDGKKMITMSVDDDQYREKYAAVWDVDTRRLFFKLEGHARNLNAVMFSADGQKIGTSSDDGQTILWDASSGEKVATLKLSRHTPHMRLMSFDLQGKYLMTATDDGMFSVWDLYGGWSFGLKEEERLKTLN
jgi:WD40 repeat protein